MTLAVSLGIHIIDVLCRPLEVLPDPNAGFPEEIRITVAGTAAGTSIDLAKLGIEVIAMGAIGDDNLGDFMVQVMTSHGIDTRHLVRKSAQTSSTILVVRPDGERGGTHIPGANACFGRDDIDLSGIEPADFLHFGGLLNLRSLSGESAAEVLRFAKENGVVTTGDVLGARRMAAGEALEFLRPCFPYLDYFLPNLAEAVSITGIDDPSEIGSFLVGCGVGCVVIKMDERGSLLVSGDREERIPAYDVKVIDGTGCGDAYCAGFIAGLAMDWDLREVGRLASAAGALVASGLGSDAGIVSLEQTIEFMGTAPTKSGNPS